MSGDALFFPFSCSSLVTSFIFLPLLFFFLWYTQHCRERERYTFMEALSLSISPSDHEVGAQHSAKAHLRRSSQFPSKTNTKTSDTVVTPCKTSPATTSTAITENGSDSDGVSRSPAAATTSSGEQSHFEAVAPLAPSEEEETKERADFAHAAVQRLASSLLLRTLIRYIFIEDGTQETKDESVFASAAAAAVDATATRERKTKVFSQYQLELQLAFCGIKRHRCPDAAEKLLSHLILFSQDFNSAAEASSAAPTPLVSIWCVPASKVSSMSCLLRHASLNFPITQQQQQQLTRVSLPVFLAAAAAATRSPDVPNSGCRRAQYQTMSPDIFAPAVDKYILVVRRTVWEQQVARVLCGELRGQLITLSPVARLQMVDRVCDGSTPLVLLCGGTSGSGKSSLATVIAEQLNITQVVSTDTVRDVLQSTLSRAEYPEVFVSTYEAHQCVASKTKQQASDGCEVPPTPEEVLEGYERQAQRVVAVLDRVIDECVSRGQSVLVEGVHLLPSYMSRKRNELLTRRVPCVAVLVGISKAERHRQRFCVRAKCMSLDSGENRYINSFDHIRTIQSYFISQAATEPIITLNNTNLDKSFMFIHRAVLELLECVHKEGWPADREAAARVPYSAPSCISASRTVKLLLLSRSGGSDVCKQRVRAAAAAEERKEATHVQGGGGALDGTDSGTAVVASNGIVVKHRMKNCTCDGDCWFAASERLKRSMAMRARSAEVYVAAAAAAAIGGSSVSGHRIVEHGRKRGDDKTEAAATLTLPDQPLMSLKTSINAREAPRPSQSLQEKERGMPLQSVRSVVGRQNGVLRRREAAQSCPRSRGRGRQQPRLCVSAAALSYVATEDTRESVMTAEVGVVSDDDEYELPSLMGL